MKTELERRCETNSRNLKNFRENVRDETAKMRNLKDSIKQEVNEIAALEAQNRDIGQIIAAFSEGTARAGGIPGRIAGAAVAAAGRAKILSNIIAISRIKGRIADVDREIEESGRKIESWNTTIRHLEAWIRANQCRF